MNRVELTGRLTKDIELKKTPNGISTTSFTVAVDRRSKEQQTADFINCVAWRQAADYLGNYGKKGNYIEVCGRIQTRNYEHDGRKVYVTEIIADEVHLVGGKKETEQGAESWETEPVNLPF